LFTKGGLFWKINRSVGFVTGAPLKGFAKDGKEKTISISDVTKARKGTALLRSATAIYVFYGFLRVLGGFLFDSVYLPQKNHSFLISIVIPAYPITPSIYIIISIIEC